MMRMDGSRNKRRHTGVEPQREPVVNPDICKPPFPIRESRYEFRTSIERREDHSAVGAGKRGLKSSGCMRNSGQAFPRLHLFMDFSASYLRGIPVTCRRTSESKTMDW